MTSHWKEIYEGWPHTWESEDSTQDRGRSGLYSKAEVDITIRLALVEHLTDLPPVEPDFVGHSGLPEHGPASLAIYARESDLLFHFPAGALIQIPKMPATEWERIVLQGAVTRPVLQGGQLEDILFTSLSAILRRHGYYLIHSSAAVHGGNSVLFVGSSGCGKTTSGLSLVAGGWRYLGDDVILLCHREDGIHALPTPGGIGVTPETMRLVPTVAARLVNRPAPWNHVKLQIPTSVLVDHWAEGERITVICFPEIGEGPFCYLEEQSKAITLARLMEDSLDRWDEPALQAHIELLETLSQQARGYRLVLGRDVAQLPDLLATLLRV